MSDLAWAVLGASLVLAGLAALFSAVALVGGLLAIISSDHRNPFVRPGLDWYERHVRIR